MNIVKPADLVQGDLYWYVEYQGESAPESQMLVRVLDVSELKLLDVFKNEPFRGMPFYTRFEEIHPNWLQVNIESIKQEQARLAEKLRILESLAT